jgi:hypothetical protein
MLGPPLLQQRHGELLYSSGTFDGAALGKGGFPGGFLGGGF